MSIKFQDFPGFPGPVPNLVRSIKDKLKMRSVERFKYFRKDVKTFVIPIFMYRATICSLICVQKDTVMEVNKLFLSSFGKGKRKSNDYLLYVIWIKMARKQPS